MIRSSAGLLGVSLLLCCAGAHAQSGTLAFDGEIVTTTCQVSANGGGSSDAAVRLPTVAARSLAASGTRAAQTAFDITIGSPSAPCTAASVRTRWVGTAANVDQNSGRLNNATGNGYASGVQVALLNDQQQDIDLRNNLNNSNWTPVNSGVARLDYFGEYYGAGSISEGLIETSAEYQVEYN